MSTETNNEMRQITFSNAEGTVLDLCLDFTLEVGKDTLPGPIVDTLREIRDDQARLRAIAADIPGAIVGIEATDYILGLLTEALMQYGDALLDATATMKHGKVGVNSAEDDCYVMLWHDAYGNTLPCAPCAAQQLMINARRLRDRLQP